MGFDFSEKDKRLMSAEKERPAVISSNNGVLMSANKTITRSNPTSASADRHISPFIQQNVQSSSIKKPVLKSGGNGSAMKPPLAAGKLVYTYRSELPVDALMSVDASARRSILRVANANASANKTLGSGMKRVTIAAQYDEDPYSRLTAPSVAPDDPDIPSDAGNLDTSFSFDERRPSSATNSASKNLRRLSFADDMNEDDMPLLSTTSASSMDSNSRRRR
jgi:hypothetical protein